MEKWRDATRETCIATRTAAGSGPFTSTSNCEAKRAGNCRWFHAFKCSGYRHDTAAWPRRRPIARPFIFTGAERIRSAARRSRARRKDRAPPMQDRAGPILKFLYFFVPRGSYINSSRYFSRSRLNGVNVTSDARTKYTPTHCMTGGTFGLGWVRCRSMPHTKKIDTACESRHNCRCLYRS